VLLPFAATCNAAQLRELFGPVQRYMVESADGSEIVTLRLADDVLRSDRLVLLTGRSVA